MSEFAADAPVSMFQTNKAWARHFRLTAVLTTAGAVAAVTTGQDGGSDPALTLAKDGTTGQYLLTLPKSPGYVSVLPTIYSPAQTIGQMAVVARSWSAGTATLMFSTKAGTNAYGASGDEIVLDLFIETRPKT